MKKFILEYWYYIGAVAGCAALALAFILKDDIHYLSFLGLINLAVINFHVLEEFRFPGGFPEVSRNSATPSSHARTPLPRTAIHSTGSAPFS